MMNDGFLKKDENVIVIAPTYYMNIFTKISNWAKFSISLLIIDLL